MKKIVLTSLIGAGIIVVIYFCFTNWLNWQHQRRVTEAQRIHVELKTSLSGGMGDDVPDGLILINARDHLDSVKLATDDIAKIFSKEADNNQIAKQKKLYDDLYKYSLVSNELFSITKQFSQIDYFINYINGNYSNNTTDDKVNLADLATEILAANRSIMAGELLTNIHACRDADNNPASITQPLGDGSGASSDELFDSNMNATTAEVDLSCYENYPILASLIPQATSGLPDQPNSADLLIKDFKIFEEIYNYLDNSSRLMSEYVSTNSLSEENIKQLTANIDYNNKIQSSLVKSIYDAKLSNIFDQWQNFEGSSDEQ